MDLNGKTILVTGGTGSFGKKFVEIVLQRWKPRKIIVFSRDEFKQFQMQQRWSMPDVPIRYFIGDIRDKERLYRAFNGVDIVVHAAAMKQVPSAEYNPFEAVKTNILGAQNIVNAAIDCGVQKVVALSTDKAVSPVNLYGATKLAMEKLIIAANSYVGTGSTVFSVVRYGNVVGSRGSVIPFFIKLAQDKVKELPITDDRMTRFWITLEQGVELVLTAIEESVGGEVFVPHIPSMRVTDLARVIIPDCQFKIIGIRPGEKLHESLVSVDEGRGTVEMQSHGRRVYAILPQFFFETKNHTKYSSAKAVPNDFAYTSDLNDQWLSMDDLRELIKDVLPE